MKKITALAMAAVMTNVFPSVAASFRGENFTEANRNQVRSSVEISSRHRYALYMFRKSSIVIDLDAESFCEWSHSVVHAEDAGTDINVNVVNKGVLVSKTKGIISEKAGYNMKKEYWIKNNIQESTDLSAYAIGTSTHQVNSDSSYFNEMQNSLIECTKPGGLRKTYKDIVTPKNIAGWIVFVDDEMGEYTYDRQHHMCIGEDHGCGKKDIEQIDRNTRFSILTFQDDFVRPAIVQMRKGRKAKISYLGEKSYKFEMLTKLSSRVYILQSTHDFEYGGSDYYRIDLRDINNPVVKQIDLVTAQRGSLD
jgi:hypothetical protein